VVYAKKVDIRFIAVILPLLLVLYLTFKTTMQRVEGERACEGGQSPLSLNDRDDRDGD
jgi:hypothetical protein